MASRRNSPTPKLEGGLAIGGIVVEAEFVHCYKYSVVDLQIIMCIRRHVTLVCPIYPPLFAFQPEHRLEVSCLLTLLVWARGWGEHCFFFISGSHLWTCVYFSTEAINLASVIHVVYRDNPIAADEHRMLTWCLHRCQRCRRFTKFPLSSRS